MPIPSQATGSTRSRRRRRSGARWFAQPRRALARRNTQRPDRCAFTSARERRSRAGHHPDYAVGMVAAAAAVDLGEEPSSRAGSRRLDRPSARSSSRSATARRPNTQAPHWRALLFGHEVGDLGGALDAAGVSRPAAAGCRPRARPRVRASRARSARRPRPPTTAPRTRRSHRPGRPAGRSRRCASATASRRGVESSTSSTTRWPGTATVTSVDCAAACESRAARPTRASVSTFCTRVGRPSTPETAVGGRRNNGSAGPPDRARTMAVDSPLR